MQKKKVYKVVFGSVDKGGEYLNTDSRTVLAVNAGDAIVEAKKLVNDLGYFVESVDLLVGEINNA